MARAGGRERECCARRSREDDRWVTSPLRRWLSSALAGTALVAAVREARRSARLVDQQARLIEEQAALRRVATLVARGAAPESVFAAVTEELVRPWGRCGDHVALRGRRYVHRRRQCGATLG